MPDKQRIDLDALQDQDGEIVAYLAMPSHPGAGMAAVSRSVRLRDLLGDYRGPDLFFDFDADNSLVGVEVLD
jgi:hypothetical protein